MEKYIHLEISIWELVYFKQTKQEILNKRTKTEKNKPLYLYIDKTG